MNIWWGRRWFQVAVAALLYAALAVLLLRPGALTACTTSVFGEPGDATGGWIWHQWNLDTLRMGPFADTTPLAAAPHGADLWRPHFLTWLLLFAPLWAVTKVVGPVCAYNVELFVGIVLSGLAMFGLVRWLTRTPAVALLAGAAYAFSPYEQMKAASHLNYVHVWIFPLLLWAALALWRDPRRGRALAVGALVGLGAYVDGYYLLLLPPVAAAMLGSWLAVAVGDRAELRRRARLTATALGASLVILLPIGFTLLTQSNDVAAVVERDARDLEIYSARPWEYLVPSVHHPVWDDVIGEWRSDHLHGSNPGEQTIYLGIVVLVGAVTFCGWAWRNRVPDDHPLRAPPRPLALALGAVVIISFLLSLPPWISIGGRRVPMPSRIVSAALPYWRVMARFFLPISAALVVLAAAALTLALARARRPGWVMAIVVPILAFDSLGSAGLHRWGIDSHTDPAYEWLADEPDDTVIAEYPLIEDIFHFQHQWYQTFQPTHRKAMLNGALWGSEFGRLTAGLTGLGDPQTIPALRALGIDLVLVHRDFFAAPIETTPAPFALSPAFEGDVVAAFDIAPGSSGSAVLGVDDIGWYRAENDGWTSRRWLHREGEMRVFRLDGTSGEVCAGFDAASFAVPRSLIIRQEGSVLFDGEVGIEPTPVSFVAQTGTPLRLSVTPEPAAEVVPGVANSGSGREISIQVSGLRATSGARHCRS